MQDNKSEASAQTVAVPESTISLFEQGIQTRLEAFSLNAQTPLDHYQEGNNKAIIAYLELLLLELPFLLNEFQLLELLKGKK